MVVPFLVAPVVSAFSFSGHGQTMAAPRLHHPPQMLADEVEMLKLQIEITQLKLNLAMAQQAASMPEVMAPTTSELPLVPATTVATDIITPPPPQVPAAPASIPVQPQVPAAPVSIPMQPALESSVVPAAGADTSPVEQALAALSSFTDGNLVPVAGALVVLPLGYVGVTKAAEFINARYDELGGGAPAGGARAQVPPPPSFTPPSPGNVLANQLAERAAQREVLQASSWDDGEGGVRGHSATEIFGRGFANLGKDPMGWFFGPPSALYSNAPPIAVSPPAGPVGLPTSPSQQQPSPPPLSLGTATASLDEAVLQPLAPPIAKASGRVVSTGSSEAMRRRSRKGRARQRAAERVAPSNPEEIDLARRGEWSYTAKSDAD